MDAVKSAIGVLRSAARIAVILAALAAAHAADQSTEYEVKAAFLLNFTKFIEWPSSSFEDGQSPLTICIPGDDPFGAALTQVVEGEVVNGRKVFVQHIQSAPKPKSCQVIFVRRADRNAIGALESVGPGVLTVGDWPEFLRAGGIIAFDVENRHVRFDINRRAAARAHLTLSARLLKVARSVR